MAVDTTNYNAGRIWKLFGTMSRKGDHTTGRPHRRSRILSDPIPVIDVNTELLQDLASPLPTGGQVPPEVPVEGKGYKNILDLPDWLDKHEILVKSEKSYQDGRIYLLDSCPFSSAHKDGTYVIRFANGAVFAGCHHASCGGGKQRWKELQDQDETREERHHRRGQRINAGKKERAKTKVSGERSGIPVPGIHKLTGGLFTTVPPDECSGIQPGFPMTDS